MKTLSQMETSLYAVSFEGDNDRSLWFYKKPELVAWMKGKLDDAVSDCGEPLSPKLQTAYDAADTDPQGLIDAWDAWWINDPDSDETDDTSYAYPNREDETVMIEPVPAPGLQHIYNALAACILDPDHDSEDTRDCAAAMISALEGSGLVEPLKELPQDDTPLRLSEGKLKQEVADEYLRTTGTRLRIGAAAESDLRAMLAGLRLRPTVERLEASLT
jgi:hypothetical protein